MTVPEYSLYKVYIQRLRRLELDDVHFQVVNDISPQLKEILKRIISAEFRDGLIHLYYGKLKDSIVAYTNFWSDTIDKSVVNSDKYSQLNKDDALSLVEITISQQAQKQIDFGKEYLPVKTVEEKEMYESIEAKYQMYIKELIKLKEEVNVIADRFFPAELVAEKIKNTTKNLGAIFAFTHKYIALMLADNLYRIRSSLEEILVHVRKNMRELKADRDNDSNALVQELYEHNKELMEMARRDPTNKLALTEIKNKVALASQRLEDHRQHKDRTIDLVTEELGKWTGRIRDFEPIARSLQKLKRELDFTVEQEKKYNEKTCMELPGTKKVTWEQIGNGLQKRKEYLNEKIVDTAKTLMTYFHVHGPSVELHTDDRIGSYSYDDYGHQVYQLEYGLRPCHVTCQLDLVGIPKNSELFAFDEMGKYRMVNGEKIYQRSNCGSLYKLDSHENLFQRISKDCGRSETVAAHCDTKIRHMSWTSGRGTEEPVDLSYKGKLDPETTKYIWETFGHILPEALAAVAEVQPENPFKYLGNRLLKLQYSWTRKEMDKRKEASAQFRQDILDGRKQKLIEATLAWRAKLREHGRQPFADDEAVKHARTHALHWWWFMDNMDNL